MLHPWFFLAMALNKCILLVALHIRARRDRQFVSNRDSGA